MTSLLDEFEIVTGPGDWDLIAGALGKPSASPEELDERLRALCRIALQEHVDWLTGRRRYGSVGEIDRHRLVKLFLDIRDQPVTVQSLVDELGFPEGRAISMASRMRYGSARALRRLVRKEALDEIQTRIAALSDQEKKGKTYALFLTKESHTCAREAAAAIVSAKGAGEGDKILPEGSADRFGGRLETSPAMWQLITTWLERESR